MTIDNKSAMPDLDAPLTEGPPAEAPTRMSVLRNKWIQGSLIAAGLFFVYYLIGGQSNPYDQYLRLADAFLHGRLYIEQPPAYLEMARYFDNGMACMGTEPGCRGYVIDPPGPAVVLMPFVVFFGPGLNQVWVSIALGAAAMGLFWVAARQLGWSARLSLAMTVLLALGTNFWWAAGDGSEWHFAHVCAVFFMMAALVEATGRKRPLVVGLLLGLSGLSRLPTFVGFPFFLYLVLKDRYDRWEWREVVRSPRLIKGVLLFGGGLGAMASLVLLYNYARFGTIFDLGYSHPMYAVDASMTKGRFNVGYIPRQIQWIFYAAPALDESRFPFFKPSQFGMALFMVTPAFLFAFGARGRGLELSAAAGIGLVMIPYLLHYSNGWTAFGYRYSLDYLPMLAVLTASGMGYRVGIRKWMVVILSVAIAMWGPLYFFDTRLEDLLGLQWKL